MEGKAKRRKPKDNHEPSKPGNQAGEPDRNYGPAWKRGHAAGARPCERAKQPEIREQSRKWEPGMETGGVRQSTLLVHSVTEYTKGTKRSYEQHQNQFRTDPPVGELPWGMFAQRDGRAPGTDRQWPARACREPNRSGVLQLERGTTRRDAKGREVRDTMKTNRHRGLS